MTAGRERRVWFLRAGPCWCRGRPGRDGSSDVLTWRRRTVPSDVLDRDLLVATASIPAYLASTVSAALAGGEWTVVTQPLCPSVDWTPEEGTLVAVGTLTSVTVELATCLEREPELLALGLLSGSGAGRFALAT